MRKTCDRCARPFETSDMADTKCAKCYLVRASSIVIVLFVAVFTVAFALASAVLLAWKLIV